MLRQTFQEYSGQETKDRVRYLGLTFDEYLNDLGLAEQQYFDGLRVMVKLKGPQVYLKRDCKDVFINNYNPTLLLIHKANIDVTFVTKDIILGVRKTLYSNFYQCKF